MEGVLRLDRSLGIRELLSLLIIVLLSTLAPI